MRITFRRRKDEIGTSTGSGRMTDERLEWHLINWKGWMHGGKVTVGFPKETPGMFSGGSAHFDDMAEACDRRVAKACDAVISGLPPGQRIAIYQSYNIGHVVYRFLRTTQAEQLRKAKDAVRAGLEFKGIV